MFGVDGTRQGYEGPRLLNMYQQIQDRLKTLPGVRAATSLDFAPFGGWSSNLTIHPLGGTQKNGPLRWLRVGPDFFSTMQIPILIGRGIERRDVAGAQLVAVVDQTFVKKYFPNENPVGQRFNFGTQSTSKYTFEIVGVSKTAELTNVHPEPRPKAYMAYAQFPQFVNTMYFEMRAAGEPTTIVSEVRDAVRQIDSGLPLMSLKTQDEQRDEALVQERLFARLSGFFGLVAVVLASIGLYGTMAYAVSRRTHEIGIRLALGAKPRDIMRMVLGRGITLVAIGAAIGIIGGLAATRLARSLIFGVTPTDAWTFVLAVIALALVALAACYIPARRAMRVDPIVALRYE